jgi:hypothetical protein
MLFPAFHPGDALSGQKDIPLSPQTEQEID